MATMYKWLRALFEEVDSWNWQMIILKGIVGMAARYLTGIIKRGKR